MKKICTSLIILSMFFMLSACSEHKDPASTVTGSGDDAAVTSQVPESTGDTTQAVATYASVDRKGILWKPVADTGGKLVVLLARSYGKPTVKVLDMNKKVIETGRFVYFSNPNRATYRFTRAGRNFPNPCLIQVGSKIFKVDKPSKRHE